MRKRLLMAAVAVVLIGVTAYVLLTPEPDTIAYHKAAYLAAGRGRPMNAAEKFWSRMTGQRIRHRTSGETMKRHLDALHRLGYWREATIIVSNRSSSDVWDAAAKEGRRHRPELATEICFVSVTESNKVILRAVPGHLPIWAGFIHEADLPAPK